MRTLAILITVLFCCSKINAQNIAGTWTGKMYVTNDTSTITFEIELNDQNSIKGYCVCYSNNKYFMRASVKGNYNSKTREISLKETKLLKTNMPKHFTIFLDRYILTLNAAGNQIDGIAKCIQGSAKNNEFSIPCREDYRVVLDLYLPPENKKPGDSSRLTSPTKENHQ